MVSMRFRPKRGSSLALICDPITRATAHRPKISAKPDGDRPKPISNTGEQPDR